MIGVYTAEQVKRSERLTMEQEKIGETELIERAAAALADEIETAGKTVVCYCGGGKNGADGIASARILLTRGVDATVVLLTENIGEETKIQLEKYKSCGGEFCLARDVHTIDSESIIVDAMLGTGLNRPVVGEIADVIDRINASGATVVACDIPTGIETDRGEVLGTAVKATKTVTFSFSKFGHILFPGREYSGQTVVKDIGLISIDGTAMLTEEGDARKAFGKRKADSHKGDYGKTVVFGGSTGLMGAGILASWAALRGGGGMVTLAYPSTYATVYENGKAWEAMSCPLPDENGAVTVAAWEKARELLKGKDAFAVGPGIGRDEKTQEFVRRLVSESELPAVVDADGLYALPKTVLSGERVLTPHAGEMARLAGISIAEVKARPVETACDYAGFCHATVLLKGATTVVASPDGRVALVTAGTPAMAKAGSGDVLTGLILSLLGRGYDGFTAACIGGFVHGRAGRLAEEKLGEYAVCASDLVQYLPQAIKSL